MLVHRRLGALAGLGAAALLATQCAPTSVAETEWKRYDRKEFHFSVALPADWKVIELDPALIDSSLDELGAENPELGKAFGPQVRAMMQSGIKFIGVDAAADFGQEGFAASLNVIANPRAQEVGIEEYLAQGVAEFKALSGVRGEVEHRLMEVAGHKAGWLHFRIVADPATGNETAMTQVYLLTHGTLVFTFTCAGTQYPRYEPVFAKIAESIRLLD